MTIPCGSIHQTPVPELADRAARHVMAYATPRALTLDPDGRVYVEAPHSAAESDLVGVYAPGVGLLGLSRLLVEDLRFEVAARGLRPVHRRKRVMGADAPALKKGNGHGQ